MNRGKKIGPRKYSAGESAMMVHELFCSQTIVTISDIMNLTGCCRQTASKLLDTVSLFLPIYHVMDSVPYEFTKKKRGVQTRQYALLKTRR